MICSRCGNECGENAKFCGNCGAGIGSTSQQYSQPQYAQQPQYVPQPQYAPQPIIINNANYNGYGGVQWPFKSKIVALLLSIFLGGFGIHRFYVGKVGTGILWLLTGGLFGFGWIIDIIIIVCGGFKDSWGRPLQ